MKSAQLTLRQFSLTQQFITTLAVTMLIPALIHILPTPTDAMTGAVLIPLFYAPLLGVFFFNRNVVSIAAAAAPFVYFLIGGRPALELTGLLSFELFFFVQAMYLLNDKLGRRFYNAPLAYAASALTAAAIAAVLPFSLFAGSDAGFVLQMAATALPGVVVLTVINYFAAKNS